MLPRARHIYIMGPAWLTGNDQFQTLLPVVSLHHATTVLDIYLPCGIPMHAEQLSKSQISLSTSSQLLQTVLVCVVLILEVRVTPIAGSFSRFLPLLREGFLMQNRLPQSNFV